MCRNTIIQANETSAKDMTIWWSLIGSAWPTTATRAAKTLTNADAITGATASVNASTTCYWGKTVSISAIADGNYKVNFEQTDGIRAYTSVMFTKGATAQTLTPATVTGFSGITVQWTPTNTALNQTEEDNQYSVYPNPTRSTVYISGFDIEEIELLSLNGKSILISNNQKIDLSGLSSGVYLCKLTTKSGLFFKKIEKI